jgi:hypothetical protein
MGGRVDLRDQMQASRIREIDSLNPNLSPSRIRERWLNHKSVSNVYSIVGGI